jgi:hypothetical protein
MVVAPPPVAFPVCLAGLSIWVGKAAEEVETSVHIIPGS